MKAVFYSELYPIRSNPLEYFKVVMFYLDLIEKNSIEAKIICRPEISRILIAKHNFDRNNFIPLTESVLKKIPMKSSWNDENVKSWINYLSGNDEINICSYMDEVLSTYFDFDILFLWGKNDNLRKFCLKNGIKIIHLELTPSRKPFIQGVTIDSLGVNGESSTRYLIESNVDMNLNEKDFIKNIKLKSVLIPLQLFDDINFQLYSPYKTISEFLFSIVPKLCDAGFEVYVKKHPGAVHRKINDFAQEKAISEISRKRKIHIIDELDSEGYKRFLNNIDSVVTVNSSVGYEAAVLGKPVVVLGKAMYKTSETFFSLEDLVKRSISRSKLNRTTRVLNSIKEKSFFTDESLQLKDFFLEKLKSYFKEEFFLNKKKIKSRIHIEMDPIIEIEYECTDYIQVKIDYTEVGLNENVRAIVFFLGKRKVSYNLYPEWEFKSRRFYIALHDKSEKIDKVHITMMNNKIKVKVI